ncbi:hypothetical protein TNIN_436141, partial [Trichonephila inaurata madagascariensis]
SSVWVDVENAPSEKSAKSEVRSRANGRVLVPVENWHRHPAAAVGVRHLFSIEARHCGVAS